MKERTLYLEIVSNHTDRVLEDVRVNLGNEGPSLIPFLGCTIEEVYDFHKTHLRPADDSVALEHFTNYTFIVVDASFAVMPPISGRRTVRLI